MTEIHYRAIVLQLGIAFMGLSIQLSIEPGALRELVYGINSFINGMWFMWWFKS